MNRLLLPTLARCLAQEPGWATRLGRADALPASAPGLSAQLAPEFAVTATGAPPWAAVLAQSAGLQPQPGQRWLALEPLCLRVAPNGIYVVGSGDFGQSVAEMHALWQATSPLLHDMGLALAGTDAQRAYLQLPADRPDPATPCAADVLGAEVTPWMPQQREWRRLLNEIQMVWAAHPVNTQRMSQGQLPINSAWLGEAAETASPPPCTLRQLYSADPQLTALAHWAQLHVLPHPQVAGSATAALLDLRDAPELAWQALQHASPGPLELRFACGARFRLRRWHQWRRWRRPLTLAD